MAKVVDKDERRAHILDAAVRVFASKGAVGLKIRDIAKEAKVAKGTVYLYFENKDAILHAIMDDLHGRGDEASLYELLASPMPAVDKLHAVVEGFVHSTLNNEYPLELMPELWAAIIRSDQKDRLNARVKNTHQAVTALLRELGAKAEKAEKLGAGMLALFHGAIILHVLSPEDFNLRDVTEAVVNMLIEGIRD